MDNAVGFGWSAIQHRLSFQPPTLLRCRIPSHRLAKPFLLLGETPVDIPAALGELGEDLVGDSFDFGDPVFWLPPFHTETSGQFRAKIGVIQGRKGPLVDLYRPGIQRQPPSIRRFDPVGDDGVGVELGVETTRGVLTEHPDHQTFSIHTDHMAITAEPRVSMRLDPGESGFDRLIMGIQHLTPSPFTSQGPQQRHRLGSREGGVETTHRLLPIPTAKIGAGIRILARHERQERLRADVTGKAKLTGCRTPPSSRRFTPIQVIRRETFGVIPARLNTLQRGHPNRHHNPFDSLSKRPRPQVCTRL